MKLNTNIYIILSLFLLVNGCAKVDPEIIVAPDPDPDQDPEEMESDTTMTDQDTIPISIVNYDLILNPVAPLPNSITESSGLARYTESTYWTHNDHGDDANLYLIDNTGTIIRELEINNSDNEDWEDLSSDPFGNLYVSDTGNNNNDRQDLRVYILLSSLLANDNAQASIINVEYEDQFDFPPTNDNLNYDVEATIYLNGYIYLFTRDRTIPFLGKTRLYRIDAIPGNQTALFISEFHTTDIANSGSITGAAISPDGNKIAIVANTKMWIFKNFKDEDFFNRDIDIFNFDTNTQIEAVDFIDNCTVILTDEKNDSEAAYLYNANICN